LFGHNIKYYISEILLFGQPMIHWATNFWSCFFYFDFLVFLDVFGALSPKMTLVFS